jgi:hypothetical protein
MAEKTVTIDGKEYKLDELSNEAKASLQSIKYVDSEIARLNATVAALKTARGVYAQLISKELSK